MRTRGPMSVIAATVAVLAVLGLSGQAGHAQSPAADSQGAPPSPRLVVSSPDFTNGGALHRAQVNSRCGGRDVSPALDWRNAPLGTRSYVLLMHDPDAPKAEGFWHWIVYDIPASVTSLPAGAGDVRKKLMPAGAVQARSDFGTPGYGGPCPPPGNPHRYFIRLYAMPVAKLNVPPGATSTIIAAYADATALGRAQIMATYGR
jgi:Raf kinase inhibitor-like YbhB/YbcL family protein